MSLVKKLDEIAGSVNQEEYFDFGYYTCGKDRKLKRLDNSKNWTMGSAKDFAVMWIKKDEGGRERYFIVPKNDNQTSEFYQYVLCETLIGAEKLDELRKNFGSEGYPVYTDKVSELYDFYKQLELLLNEK